MKFGELELDSFVVLLFAFGGFGRVLYRFFFVDVGGYCCWLWWVLFCCWMVFCEVGW
jgi:hypothetical protein